MLQVLKVPKMPKVLKALKVLKVPKVLKVSNECKHTLTANVPKVLMVPRVLKGKNAHAEGQNQNRVDHDRAESAKDAKGFPRC